MNKGNDMGKRASVASSTSRVLRSATGGNNHFINQPRSHAVPIDQHTIPITEIVQLKDKDKKKGKGKKTSK